MLMRTTGSVHSVMGGSFDSSKGEFRLCGVTAGVEMCIRDRPPGKRPNAEYFSLYST